MREKLFEFLEGRCNQLDGIVISGGEPTIQSDLSIFISRIKAMKFAVKLDTNGSRPEVICRLLEHNLIDYIAMDIKAPFAIYDRLTGVLSPISRIKESIALITGSNIKHEFRTTIVESLLSPDDVLSIKRLIPIGSTYRLQKFRSEHILDNLV